MRHRLKAGGPDYLLQFVLPRTSRRTRCDGIAPEAKGGEVILTIDLTPTPNAEIDFFARQAYSSLGAAMLRFLRVLAIPPSANLGTCLKPAAKSKLDGIWLFDLIQPGGVSDIIGAYLDVARDHRGRFVLDSQHHAKPRVAQRQVDLR